MNNYRILRLYIIYGYMLSTVVLVETSNKNTTHTKYTANFL